MNDSHDNGAAKLLADWCHATDQHDAQLRPEHPGRLGEVYRYGIRTDITTAHVRAVLAENETMRQQLATMTTGYGLEWTNRNTGEHGTTALTSRAKAAELHAACHDFDTTIVSRLVGEWQPADPVQREQNATDTSTSEGE